MGKVEKTNVVVLGASTGTGAACVRAFARAGARVVGFHLGRHAEEAEKLASDFLAYSHTYDCEGGFVITDAGSSYEAVQKAVTAIEHLDSVDVLIHALSGASIGSTIGTSPKGIERTFNLMAHSFLWWTQELLKREMLATGTQLFALTNPLPYYYLNGSGVVGPAKAALETYVRHLAVELGPQGVRVNAVRFSTVMTPALEKVVGPAAPRLKKLHKRIVPAGRMQTAEDVAALLVSMSESDIWMNGAVLDYTGGSTTTLLDYAFRG